MTEDALQAQSLEAIPQGIAMLEHLRNIRIGGDEAEQFLQGQFSSDVVALNPGNHQPGAYCNPKGRAIAIYRLLRDDDGFNLVVPEDMVDTVVKRLTLFRMRSRVDIDIDDERLLVGAFGLKDLIPRSCWKIDDVRTLCLIGREQLPALADSHNVLPSSTWKLGEILAVEPQVYAATTEEFIPQQVNLDLVGGVSFSKGCYPGQEIVARVRYLGKIKQRMLSGRIQSNPVPANPGDLLFAADRPAQKSGIVVDSVRVGEDDIVTAMIPAALLQGGEIYFGAADGPAIIFNPAPYTITTERDK